MNCEVNYEAYVETQHQSFQAFSHSPAVKQASLDIAAVSCPRRLVFYVNSITGWVSVPFGCESTFWRLEILLDSQEQLQWWSIVASQVWLNSFASLQTAWPWVCGWPRVAARVRWVRRKDTKLESVHLYIIARFIQTWIQGLLPGI